MIDLGAEIRTVLVDLGLAAEQLDARLERVVERVLERRSTDRLLTMAQAAEFLGRSRAGFERWLSREQGREVRELATAISGKRMWRRSDLEALAARGGPSR